MHNVESELLLSLPQTSTTMSDCNVHSHALMRRYVLDHSSLRSATSSEGSLSGVQRLLFSFDVLYVCGLRMLVCIDGQKSKAKLQLIFLMHACVNLYPLQATSSLPSSKPSHRTAKTNNNSSKHSSCLCLRLCMLLLLMIPVCLRVLHCGCAVKGMLRCVENEVMINKK